MGLINLTTKQIYVGDNSTVVFAIPFDIVKDKTGVEEVEVILRDETNPLAITETLQTITTHYTLTGGSPVTDVTMVTAPTATQYLVVRRKFPLTQIADYITNGTFPAETHELALDRVVAMTQLLNEFISRVPQLTKGTRTNISKMPEPIAETVWGWDTDAETIRLYTPAEIASIGTAGLLQSALNLSDVASAAAALVNLGITATATELNYVDGVTSDIQTQLNGKQASGAYLTDLSAQDTDDLVEGSTNLYFTNARADARIAAASIDALTDVDITTTPPANGETLVWATNKFVPGAASGGGGGGSLRWVEGPNAPILSYESGLEVYAYTPALAQDLYTTVRVPSSYVAGKPINLKVLWTCASVSGNALLLAQSTLIRSEVDAITSTTNQRTTTNSLIVMSGANTLEPQKITLDISSAIGEINGVAISAGDLIKVRVYESAGTTADDVKLIPDASEVTFT